MDTGEKESGETHLRKEQDAAIRRRRQRRRSLKKTRTDGSGEESEKSDKAWNRVLKRGKSSLFPANEGEAADVLMFDKDAILEDKIDRKLRNLNQLRRSSVVSGMKELWMEDLPHPQRGYMQAGQPWAGDIPYANGTYPNEREKLEKELYQCLSARTALILPFHWGDNQKSVSVWIDRLLKRTITDKETGKRIKIWENDFMLPFEVSELSAHFRQIVGWNETVKRFLHEQSSATGAAPTDSFRDVSQSIHLHNEFIPRCKDRFEDVLNDFQKDEKKRARMRRMTAGGGVRFDRRGRQDDGHEDSDRGHTTEEGETDEEGPGTRNCVLMDEGGDIEAEQEEEDVDSIANDLEVWKCQRMKLTKKAREILFPNPCIWASSGEGMPSPVQARDEERRRHMSERMQSSDVSSSEETASEDDETKRKEKEKSEQKPTPIPRIHQPPVHMASEPALHIHKPPPHSLPSSWEDYALTGAAPADTPVRPEAPPPSGALLSNCENKIGFEVEMSSVELVMYPLGCGLLVFHLNWMPEKLKDVPLTLDELRTWLFLVKFRHKVKKVFLGWTLGLEAALIAHGLSGGQDSKKEDMSPYLPSHLRSLGRLGNSIYGDELLSLCTIGNWLLQLPNEDPTAPIRRISYGACANHHTTVVLHREPEEDDLREYLFHLTRAFGQRNRPPPPGLTERQRLDHMLIHRMNRYIGISREGTVAMSWPTDPANQHFEAHTWPKLFQGVYLILCLHARGEASVLSELSNLSASAAEHLRLESLTEGETLEKLERDRTYLRYLAVLLIKYSLGMSSDDCGGLSEYSHFFSTMRRVLRIPETRQEIREEIHDVLGIVEGGYLEEQRRQLQEEKRVQRKKERERYKSDRDKDAQKRRIEILLSIIGAITLPLVLVSGIWGMNVHDLPDLSFWPLLGVTSATSFIFLCVLLGWLLCLSPRPRRERSYASSGGGNGGYTSLSNGSGIVSSPRVSMDLERSGYDAARSSLDHHRQRTQSFLSSAFKMQSRLQKERQKRHYDILVGVGSPAPPRSRMGRQFGDAPRVSFKDMPPREHDDDTDQQHQSDLYTNPW